MFGKSNGKSDAKEAEQAAKARKIEALQNSLNGSIESMAPFVEAGNTEKCEAVVERLKTSLKNPILPPDFRNQAMAKMDLLVRDSFMKATDIAVHAAQAAAMQDDREARDKKITEAREKLAGAVRLKAPPEFKRTCDRAIEAASLSGGIKKDGPTKAKPADFAPKTLNKAKPDEGYYKELEKADALVGTAPDAARPGVRRSV